MEFEKIKLALALKGIEMVLLYNRDSTLHMGFLVYIDSSDGHGYRESLKNSNGQKIIRISKSKNEVAEKLYKWVIENGTKKYE